MCSTFRIIDNVGSNNEFDRQDDGPHVGKMSKEKKQTMMEKMMDKFFADMKVEDKQKLMEKMIPKMMEGINLMEMMPRLMMGMMSKMTENMTGS